MPRQLTDRNYSNRTIRTRRKHPASCVIFVRTGYSISRHHTDLPARQPEGCLFLSCLIETV